MNSFEVIIGIEIHLELKTKTKMFSPAPIDFLAEPNTAINQIDLGYPGTLPLLNKEAVIYAIKLAKALNMNIDTELHFDRKNYFYTDLPKGYQITQFFRPIGSNGYIITDFNTENRVEIERIHLEEDTARQHHGVQTKLDYNRAGVPLIEIVTKPCIRSAEEAVAYVNSIRQTALALDISDAKMELGSLRADINISLRPKGFDVFGTKVEIKNIATFRGIAKAIENEIQIQTKKLRTGEKIMQQTKRFDPDTQSNIPMRTKTGQVDYKYFPEPNIPIIQLSKEFVNSVKLSELPWERTQRYRSYGIQDIYINSLINDIDLAKYFDSIDFHDKQKLSKLFFAEVVSLANSTQKHVCELNIKPSQLVEAINLLENEVISGRSFKKLVPLLQNNSKSLDDLVQENKLAQISDTETITKWVLEIISQNEQAISEYPNRPERVLKMIQGSLMKISGGQINPNKASQIVQSILEQKFN
ncbi:aspartyl/glutamyl-tRNA amidotransferase subunit B [Mycoplasmopsis californica HAZ160_1]|uniref:Aspartyl/glutamyl-tRNA(Asn/Gln) amidotransferase subunit B n=1 Tax=Mycoplasmopsis californica HAZ160_1 TaxID=1397850 RepID=A0AAT9F7H4_9BACT|nr:Asp-tRNA(Asn)/Glu-tRNA(Gln) amidotransferase subunit GatB [Mycoplasmopsis californica]BAP00837.1 aspartyl/glutamyl-tRNA amidotransferase subunit B [Mycoplasmopsis californica HAZ160_1]BBG40693.1 aspartyl/glutamyl-tRNA amidotransferase subunit B [Mycoplasmopsis californica]BBG41287.1 aspartyl/glutamyl-tRNA amidotransferase subunit B [Mycoplasmopsis californica]BBG41880.1 aspartyl/glutamyl-tRNA amidotransferase subunit B [Mycoplasmopsis californica]BBG42473.1 aspartyl/glutamyl-tRNA amidotrans